MFANNIENANLECEEQYTKCMIPSAPAPIKEFTLSDDKIIFHAIEYAKINNEDVDWEFVGDFLDFECDQVIRRYNFLRSRGVYNESLLVQYWYTILCQ